jgi:hypothetical protein
MYNRQKWIHCVWINLVYVQYLHQMRDRIIVSKTESEDGTHVLKFVVLDGKFHLLESVVLTRIYKYYL